MTTVTMFNRYYFSVTDIILDLTIKYTIKTAELYSTPG